LLLQICVHEIKKARRKETARGFLAGVRHKNWRFATKKVHVGKQLRGALKGGCVPDGTGPLPDFWDVICLGRGIGGVSWAIMGKRGCAILRQFRVCRRVTAGKTRKEAFSSGE